MCLRSNLAFSRREKGSAWQQWPDLIDSVSWLSIQYDCKTFREKQIEQSQNCCPSCQFGDTHVLSLPGPCALNALFERQLSPHWKAVDDEIKIPIFLGETHGQIMFIRVRISKNRYFFYLFLGSMGEIKFNPNSYQSPLLICWWNISILYRITLRYPQFLQVLLFFVVGQVSLVLIACVKFPPVVSSAGSSDAEAPRALCRILRQPSCFAAILTMASSYRRWAEDQSDEFWGLILMVAICYNEVWVE